MKNIDMFMTPLLLWREVSRCQYQKTFKVLSSFSIFHSSYLPCFQVKLVHEGHLIILGTLCSSLFLDT